MVIRVGRDSARASEQKPDCYGSYGFEKCILADCSFHVACDKEEIKSFREARARAELRQSIKEAKNF